MSSKGITLRNNLRHHRAGHDQWHRLPFPGDLEKVQNLGPHSRPTKSESAFYQDPPMAFVDGEFEELELKLREQIVGFGYRDLESSLGGEP